jgi:2-C-methyl-D-erythritol 4-phosphate cytidylyltransferase
MTAQSLTKTLKVALICAAGVGARAGGDVPKQYQLIHGVPMLVHTVRAFERSCVDAVCVVISPDDAWYDECVAPLVGTAVQVLRVGGTSRASSVANGLLALIEDFHGQSWVLVHDAARPCISPSLIARLCESTSLKATPALANTRRTIGNTCSEWLCAVASCSHVTPAVCCSATEQ